MYLVTSFKSDPYIYRLTSNNNIRATSNNSIRANSNNSTNSDSNNNTNSIVLMFISNILDYITRIVAISKGSSRRVQFRGSSIGSIYILATIRCIYTRKVSIV